MARPSAAPVLILVLLLCASGMMAGCTSLQPSAGEQRTGVPTIDRTPQPVAPPRISPAATPPPVQPTRLQAGDSTPQSVPGARSQRSVTLPGDRESSPALSRTVPSPVVTWTAPPASPDADLQEITAMLTGLPETWKPTGAGCDSTSCTGTFVNGQGETLTVRVTLYPDADAARQAYDAEKSSHPGLTTVPFPYGDASFAYTGRSGTGAVLLEGPALVSMTLTSPAGTPTTDEIAAVVQIVASGLSQG